MIAIVWRYEVREEHREAFEAAYGPGGDWARLFTRGEGYHGTQLMRAEDGSYLTLDLWRSHADFDRFLSRHRGDYDALDAAAEAWTSREQRLGEHELLD